MKKSEFSKLAPLLKKHLFTASEARSFGVSAALLTYYAKRGLIERVDRGVYRGVNSKLEIDFKWEDLYLAQRSILRGVVCLISALAIYELTDEIPRKHWIAVDHSCRAPKRKNVKVVRIRNFKLGISEYQLGEVKIKIYNKERTIVDAFRFLSFETAMKSLKMGLALGGENKIDLKKINSYAKKLRVNIRPYIMAVTA